MMLSSYFSADSQKFLAQVTAAGVHIPREAASVGVLPSITVLLIRLHGRKKTLTKLTWPGLPRFYCLLG